MPFLFIARNKDYFSYNHSKLLRTDTFSNHQNILDITPEIQNQAQLANSADKSLFAKSIPASNSSELQKITIILFNLFEVSIISQTDLRQRKAQTPVVRNLRSFIRIFDKNQKHE